MTNKILTLEPRVVWEYFYQLTQIPRPSGHEKAIQDVIENFGRSLGFETIRDEVGNIIIRKPATPGMENRKGVILQGHLDMVPQANSDKVHDFTKDAIETLVDGDWVTANGTTLGADNGMGVAAAMAILASTDIEHGPLEGLFTAEEETGMTGAFGLKPGLLNGEILMNMDSEDEGELYVGCAGGLNGSFTFEAEYETVLSGHEAFQIKVLGLKGGHSGMDIVLGRGNANKILFRFLKLICDQYGARIASIKGGSLRNAIPREGFATVVVPMGNVSIIKEQLANFEQTIKIEYGSVEPNFSISALHTEIPSKVLTVELQNRLILAINACPNGVIRMSQDMPGLVETSSNLAVVKTTDDDQIQVLCLLRSSVDSAKYDLATSIGAVFELAEAEVNFTGDYPGWKPNLNSQILKTMQSTYQKITGKVPEIKAIHAGLECGLFGAVYPDWDMISFGPTIRFPHSPDEKVNIASVANFYGWLVETLKAIPVK